MKVVEKLEMQPLKVTCQVCGSHLELNPQDFRKEHGGVSADYICPVCGRLNDVHYMYIHDPQFKLRIHQLARVREEQEEVFYTDLDMPAEQRTPRLGIRLGKRTTLSVYSNDDGIVMKVTKESRADL